MKFKKILLIIPVIIVLVIIGVIYLNYYKIVYLDINPSIELKINNMNKVKEIKALNKDGQEVIKDIENNDLNKVLDSIIKNTINKHYIENDQATILLYVDGNDNKIKKIINKKYQENKIKPDIITVDKITEKDKKLAKKYNISPSKAAYINSIKKIKIEDVSDRAIKEINTMAKSKITCPDGYIIKEEKCFKEIGREKAVKGQVCPDNTYEKDGICYKETNVKETGKKICNDGLVLENNKCVNKIELDPEPDCGENEYYSDKNVCLELVYVEDAIEFCRDPNRVLYDNKCLASKPTINGGCLGSDRLIFGQCVNLIDDYYPSEYKCSNGQVISNADGSLLYPDKKCYDKKEIPVTKYKCPTDYKLKGNRCVSTYTRKPIKEVTCPNNYTLVDNNRCINKTKKVDKEDGYICSKDNSRLEGNECVIYKIIEAK